MKKIASRLALVGAMAASLSVAVPAASAAPGPVDVQLRVETPTETLFNGPQTTAARTGARGINLSATTVADECDHGYNPDYSYVKQDIANATALTAAADFADAEGLDHIVKDFGFGHLLCGLGAMVGGNDQFWLVKVNNRTTTAGGGFVSADTEVKTGDEVLWYFTSPSITHTLDLDLPAKAVVGEYVSGTVTKYSNNTDVATPARRATVEGGGASGVTDVNGKARLKFSEPGVYLVSAAASGATRGSDVIEVVEAPGPDATLKARRVCAKYRRGWRKYNKRYKRLHKRCMRTATRRFALGS